MEDLRIGFVKSVDKNTGVRLIKMYNVKVSSIRDVCFIALFIVIGILLFIDLYDKGLLLS